MKAALSRLGIVRWALSCAWDINRWLLLSVFVAAVALSVLPAVSLQFNRDIIESLSSFIATGVGSFQETLPAIVVYGVLLAIIGLSTRVNAEFIGTLMNTSYIYGMQERLIDVIDRFQVIELLKRNVNEDFNYIVRQAGALPKTISALCSIGAKSVGVASLAIVAWGLSRPIFFITLAYVVIAVMTACTFSKGTRYNFPKFRKAEVKAQYLQNMPLESNIAKEVRVYGCADGVIESWNAAYAHRMNMEIGRFRATELRSFALGAGFYVFLAVVMSFLVVGVSNGTSDPAHLLTTFTLCTSLFASVSVLSRDLINLDDALFRIEQMQELLRGEPLRLSEAGDCAVKSETDSGSQLAVDVSREAGSKESAAVFSACDVSFSYDGNQRVLDHVSFDIHEGEVVALVGVNGSGKSTLVKLLLGVFSPDEGSLLYRGIPYADLTPDRLSTDVGAFFQDFYLYHHSLAENVAYGSVGCVGDCDQVREALCRGGADKMADSLPRDLDTLVGKRIDKEGIELSGGQRQLLGIARAYMGDKKVLIFDEPASMLDPLAELDQFQAIRRRIDGCAGVLISHRVGFARLADRVIMMDGGRIVECGTHDELMARDGAYAAFFREQAQWYMDSSAEAQNGGACHG